MSPSLDDAPPAIAALILSGGAARRMGGGDKGTTLVGEQSILARIIECLRPQASALALNANGDAGRFADFGLTVIPDPPHGEGPLAGILAGLDWAAAAGCPWLLTTPTDTPFLPDDLALRLYHCAGSSSAAIASSGGRAHPVIGLWSVELAPLLRQFLLEEGERKAHSWARRCNAAVVNWSDAPVEPFFNVNTPEDGRLASQLAEIPANYAGVIVPPKHQSCDDLLAAFADEARREGFRLGGVLQRRAETDVDMMCLETGQTYPIMQKLGRDACCAVDPQALASVSVALRRSIEHKPDLVIINKFGHLEEDGEGLADEMMSAMAQEIKLLTTVSVKRLPAWLKFCGDHCTLLPPHMAAIRRWWSGARARQAS